MPIISCQLKKVNVFSFYLNKNIWSLYPRSRPIKRVILIKTKVNYEENVNSKKYFSKLLLGR